MEKAEIVIHLVKRGCLTAWTAKRLVWDVCETLSVTISTAYDATIEIGVGDSKQKWSVGMECYEVFIKVFIKYSPPLGGQYFPKVKIENLYCL